MRILLPLILSVAAVNVASGFQAQWGQQRQFQQQQHISPSSTALYGSNGFVPPTMIISGILKKMREANEEKNRPLALEEERATEAPGLKVGSQAWKWPGIWPFADDLFIPPEDNPAPSPQQSQAASVMNMMGVNPNAEQSTLPGALPDATKEKLDVFKYWDEDKKEVKTVIDGDTIQKLTEHYSFYLADGLSVLELGAGENSYLPEGLKFSQHVGVSASMTAMNKNSALTDRLQVNLNDVVDGYDIDSDELRKLAGTFDVILMANTVDFLSSPREVFRSAWNLLKPGGLMMVSFTSKDAYTDKFQRAQTKMWREMNDDQHMWVVGSFFQFSAGEGWESLKGFDISPESARKDDQSMMSKMVNRGGSMNMYVVQAIKGQLNESIDDFNPENSFQSKMWMLPTLEKRDKDLMAPRLAQIYKTNLGEERNDGEAWSERIKILPKVYESLIKMDQFAFPIALQAQLAADLVGDLGFEANDEQIDNLKMGLGLKPPSESFWAPVGSATAAMEAEDKVNLLSHIIPRFGSGDPAQEDALRSFATGLSPTFALIRTKCPSMSESDVQLVGSELLASEILTPGRSTREEFAVWLGALTEEEVQSYLEIRQQIRKDATANSSALIKKREDEAAEIENAKKLMQEQIDTARKDRTTVFNPKTGKMEVVEKK